MANSQYIKRALSGLDGKVLTKTVGSIQTSLDREDGMKLKEEACALTRLVVDTESFVYSELPDDGTSDTASEVSAGSSVDDDEPHSGQSEVAGLTSTTMCLMDLLPSMENALEFIERGDQIPRPL